MQSDLWLKIVIPLNHDHITYFVSRTEQQQKYESLIIKVPHFFKISTSKNLAVFRLFTQNKIEKVRIFCYSYNKKKNKIWFITVLNRIPIETPYLLSQRNIKLQGKEKYSCIIFSLLRLLLNYYWAQIFLCTKMGSGCLAACG